MARSILGISFLKRLIPLHLFRIIPESVKEAAVNEKRGYIAPFLGFGLFPVNSLIESI